MGQQKFLEDVEKSLIYLIKEHASYSAPRDLMKEFIGAQVMMHTLRPLIMNLNDAGDFQQKLNRLFDRYWNQAIVTAEILCELGCRPKGAEA